MKLAAMIAALALGAAAAGVNAQTTNGPLNNTREVGSAIPIAPTDINDPALAARYSKAVAECTFRRMGAGTVDRILRSSDPVTLSFEGSGVAQGRLRRSLENCMGVRMDEYSTDILLSRLGMSLSPNRLRALLLEEAYLEKQDAPPAVGESEMTARSFVSGGDALASARGVGALADCTVYRDAAGADALLRTQPGSPAEDAAARKLAPVLAGCLMEGQSVRFTPSSIRAIAADGLWSRVAYGAMPAVAQAGK